MQCIYTGVYDPYTVDTPHDRTYHVMGGEKSTADHTCTFRPSGLFRLSYAINYGFGRIHHPWFHLGLCYRNLTKQRERDLKLLRRTGGCFSGDGEDE